jgi:NodT family efflux transporter outer membrane factor (OMF) lipoprotein
MSPGGSIGRQGRGGARRWAACLLPGLAAGILAGCASLPPPEPPTLPLEGVDAALRFSGQPSAVEAVEPTDDELHWWRRFDDPALGLWVERVLDASIDVAVAGERVLQAQALLAGTQAARGPRLAAQADTELNLRQRSGQRAVQPGAGLSLEWNADLFGGLRWAERAASAEVQRSREGVQAVRLAQAALAARSYIEWRAAQLDAAALDEGMALQREALRIVGVRFDVGLAPRLDLERAQAEVASLEAEFASAAARVRRSEAALHVLAADPRALLGAPGDVPGRSPEPVTAAALPALSDTPALPRPLDLVRLRPDLRAAEQALVGAAAQVGVAEAALRPQLRLPGRIVFGAVAGGGWLELTAVALGALLDVPLFDGGARQADLGAASSRAREAELVWRQTLLQALGEVEIALAAQTGSARRSVALARARDAGDAAVEQARTLYTAGLTGFLDLVDAQRSALASRRAWLQAQADAATAAVATFEALGWVPPPQAAIQTVAPRAAPG